MAAQVSTCLKHLQQMCRSIKIANKKDKLKIDNHLLDDVPIEPESFDVDGTWFRFVSFYHLFLLV